MSSAGSALDVLLSRMGRSGITEAYAVDKLILIIVFFGLEFTFFYNLVWVPTFFFFKYKYQQPLEGSVGVCINICF